MPCSTIVGKSAVALVLSRFNATRPVRQIVDIGPGMGSHKRLFGKIVPDARWIAVEIWGPYLARYGLDRLYDRVYLSDATCFDFSLIEPGGVILFGDVLEHMKKDTAQRIVARSIRQFDLAVLSVPIGHWPQDEENENPWEKHVDDWNVDDIDKAFAESLGGTIPVMFKPGIGLAVAFLAKPHLLKEVGAQVEECRALLQSNRGLVDCNLGFLPDLTDDSVVEAFRARIGPHIA
jgi:hypothetical protein